MTHLLAWDASLEAQQQPKQRAEPWKSGLGGRTQGPKDPSSFLRAFAPGCPNHPVLRSFARVSSEMPCSEPGKMTGRKNLANGGPAPETSLYLPGHPAWQWLRMPGCQKAAGQVFLEPGKGKARDLPHRVWDPAVCSSVCSGHLLWLRNGKRDSEVIHFPCLPLKSLVRFKNPGPLDPGREKMENPCSFSRRGGGEQKRD